LAKRKNYPEAKARICKRLWIPGIDSEESISAANEAWRAGMKNTVVIPGRQVGIRFLGSLKGLQIRASGACAVSVTFLQTESRGIFSMRSSNFERSDPRFET
jgi:hypothetical protein